MRSFKLQVMQKIFNTCVYADNVIFYTLMDAEYMMFYTLIWYRLYYVLHLIGHTMFLSFTTAYNINNSRHLIVQHFFLSSTSQKMKVMNMDRRRRSDSYNYETLTRRSTQTWYLNVLTRVRCSHSKRVIKTKAVRDGSFSSVCPCSKQIQTITISITLLYIK